MNAGSIFTFLGLVAFVFVVLMVISMEGLALTGAAPALLLLIAFLIAITLIWLSTLRR